MRSELFISLHAGLDRREVNDNRALLDSITESLDPSTTIHFIPAQAIAREAGNCRATATHRVMTMSSGHARTIASREFIERCRFDVAVLKGILPFIRLLITRVRIRFIRGCRVRRRVIVTASPQPPHEQYQRTNMSYLPCWP
jgi:hypothetical protein